MAATHTVVDARGRTLSLALRPQRIVSLVPSITETLFDLGAGDRIVGVTRWCVHPADARTRARVVGGTHDVDLDVLARLEPDLVIANQEENPKPLVERLATVAPTYVTFPRTVRDGIVLLRRLGELTDQRDAGARAAARVEAAHRRARRADPQRAPRVLYLIWRRPWMSVNRDTFVHDMLTTCGAVNVLAHAEARYPTLSDADAAALRPDAILLSSEPYAFRERHREEWLRRGDLPAARLGQVHLVDGELCCWYGTRLLRGLPYLAARIGQLRAEPE